MGFVEGLRRRNERFSRRFSARAALKDHRHIGDAIGALEVKLDEQDLKQLTAPYQAKGVLYHNV